MSMQAPARVRRRRMPLLLGAGVALVLGMYTGLARGGIEHRFVGADLHAVLMALGFLGTLIALERAVALGRAWGYLAPAISVAAVVLLPVARTAGGVLLVAAGGIVTLTYVALLRHRVELHVAIMGMGGLAWVGAAVLWLTGAGPIRITPLLAAFLVLTIVGERLELSRLTTLPGPASRRWFLLAIGAFALGAVLAPAWRSTGLVLAGVGLLGQVAWLGRHDVARRTVRRAGLPRFAAVCMLAGYLWLAVSGALWVATGAGVSGPLLHDALVHSLFLGFVLSMVMGHAPIIVPAVLGAPLRFSRWAWAPLVLLHVSVAVRVAADLFGSLAWREVALHGNVTALVLFAVVVVVTVRRSRDTDGGQRSTVPAASQDTDTSHGRGGEVEPGRTSRHAGMPGGGTALRGVHRLSVASALGVLLLIAMGGAVRATDSGLACPDWPACYGKWIPPADVNMWFEHSHRLWAGVVALAIAWLAAWTLLRFRDRPALWRLSLTAFVLVMVQAGLGAAVVLLELRAGLVTAHLGMSFAVVGCLVVLAVLTRDPVPASPGDGARWVGRWAAATGGLVFLQALLGAQATGRGAAFVFNTVPIWLAEHTWTGHAREWLHVTHRAGGYLVATAVVVFAVAVHRRRRTDPTLPRWAGTLARLAVVLVLAQVTLGIANVLTRATVVSAVGHLAVASWLWATFVLVAARGLLTPSFDEHADLAMPAPTDADAPTEPHAHHEPRPAPEEVNA